MMETITEVNGIGDAKILDIIMPCYNEDEIILSTLERLSFVIRKIKNTGFRFTYDVRVIVVDDGSTDATVSTIKKASAKLDFEVHILRLGVNSGQQLAIIAGMEYSVKKSFAMVTIDADLQDDIDLVIEMITKFELGFQAVLGVRSDRLKDSLGKRSMAQIYYWITRKILRIHSVYNHGDFRLISNKLASHVLNFKETNIYLRGIIPIIDKDFAVVNYPRSRRSLGKTKYTFIKSFNLAVTGICSLSAAPLRIISVIGLFFSIASLLIIVAVVTAWLNGFTVPGWASITTSVFLLGSVQLLCLGIISEYLARIFSETKNRPRYFVSSIEIC